MTKRKIEIEKMINALRIKLQFKVSQKEMKTYLKDFVQLENLLLNFRREKLPKKTKHLKMIETGYLSIAGLKKISKKFSQPPIVPVASFIEFVDYDD